MAEEVAQVEQSTCRAVSTTNVEELSLGLMGILRVVRLLAAECNVSRNRGDDLWIYLLRVLFHASVLPSLREFDERTKTPECAGYDQFLSLRRHNLFITNCCPPPKGSSAKREC